MARPFTSDMAEGRGQLTAPVAGGIVRAFGADTEAGPASGVSYQAPPNARVVSPCGGRVVFAGPFRSFGLLMIVDCGAGYHFVMSGLERLDSQVGQTVQPGEPVGVMPGWDPGTAENSRPTLYLELRKDGIPVNPAPFLRARS
jgi:septal ring factor EnvC (AmiA/AmiB activator)